MRILQPLRLLLAVTATASLFALVLSATALAADTALPATVASKIDRHVLRATESEAVSSFVVVLSDQADVSAAYTMTDPDARGWYVYNTLVAHAQRTQGPLRRALGGAHSSARHFWVVNAIVTRGARRLVEQLAARADVRAIEADLPTFGLKQWDQSTTSQPAIASLPWGLVNINAPQLWDLGFTGQEIVIGNQDTGVQWDHPALRPHYRGWNGSNADHNHNWHDAIHSGGGVCGADSPVPCDDYSHGTHTTGTAVGSDGAASVIGVAPGATWIGCRNMDRGFGTPTTYLECFQFFLAPTDLSNANPDPSKRPHIMNNSWGCPPSEGCAANALRTAVENAEASGIFVEASAGNAGPLCSTVNDPPAIYAASFSTAAYDESNTLASWSSRGPVLVDDSGRMKPDLAAPGVGVLSSVPTNSYAYYSGTSMAGPHVVGAVALLWSARPELARDVASTKALLQSTANPNVTVSPPVTCGGTSAGMIPNNLFGFGRLDVLAALTSLSATATPTPIASPTPPPSPTTTLSPPLTVTSTRLPSPTITPSVPPSPTVTSTPPPSPTTTPTLSPSRTATATVAPSRTATSTPPSSPSPTPSTLIAGRVRYYSADRPVPQATVALDGPTTNTTLTATDGGYTFAPVPPGDWTLSPTKLGELSTGVSSLDAVHILQQIVGLRTLDAQQILACDVSGNGTLSTLDATLILRWKVGLIAQFPVAETCASDWLFVPSPAAFPNQRLILPSVINGTCRQGAIAFDQFSERAENQDWLAIAFGDCTGNWESTPAPATTGTLSAGATASVRFGSSQRHGAHSILPIVVDAPNGFYSLDVRLRSTAPAASPPRVRRSLGARAALLASNVTSSGELRIAIASPTLLQPSGGAVLYVELPSSDRRRRAAAQMLSASVDDHPVRISGPAN